MTASITPTILHGDVAEGDELPQLEVEVTATTVVLGALASRDWRPMHHDYEFAVGRQGTQNIFLNTPNQAAWFERYITDWTGPTGRLGKMTFRMRDSVFPGDLMTLSGTVTASSVDTAGVGWVDLDVQLTTGEGRVCTTCATRVALPTNANDNPWRRTGDQWKP
jgi:acyl dehydratase